MGSPSSSRWKKVRELFERVSDLSPEAREAVLQQACANDSSLRTSVEKLLAADDEEFLARPVAPLKALSRESFELQPGTMLGGFVIERLLGAGGMGIVYEARQSSPARRVALKVMRPELGSSESVRRFEVEAEVLATMRHPGIAQVFAAGVYELASGAIVLRLPWYAMELVEGGIDVVRHALEASLDLGRRLTLFERICEAVHHAHMRSVIHRDLKPANVLVDREGNPKVIDFGIARATSRSPSEESTRPGQMMGTPRYMAPEQRAGDRDLDVRCDVWSLGVILGELVEEVGGHPPQAGLPPCRSRHTKELGWILGKARAEQREDRYESAAALADDLRRLRKNEPLEAAPPMRLYEWSKLVRRHWKTFTAIFSIIASLTAGWIVTATALRDAEHARQTALEEREAARRAQSTTSIAVLRMQVILDLLTDIFARAKGANRGEDLTMGEFLLSLSEELEARPPDSPALTGALWTYFADLAMARGEGDLAAECAQAALRVIRTADYPGVDVDRVVGFAGLSEAMRLRGRYAEAQESLDQALELAQTCDLDELTRASLKRKQALLYLHANRLPEAISLLRDALDVRRSQLGPKDPKSLEVLIDLGSALGMSTATLPEAIEVLQEARALAIVCLAPGDPKLLNLRNSLSVLLGRLGRWKESRDQLEQVVRDFTAQWGESDYRTRATMANLAKALENSDEPERARDCLAHLLEVCSATLGAEHLETMEIRRRLGLLLLGQGRPEEGEALLAAHCDPSQANGDEVQAYLSCAVVRARCLWAMNRRDDAIQAFRSARMEFVSRFGALFPEVTRLDAYLKREGIDLRE